MSGLISELKRRNVFRVATAYVVSGWVVVQVVDLATEAFAAPSWVMQMTIALLVAGFIPALIVSWAFELTPEGLKRESELSDQPAAARHTGQRLNIAVIVLLLVAIALLLADRFLFTRQAIDSRVQTDTGESVWQLDSVAVLPFADFSPGRDQDWLGEGIAETLLHALAQVDGLRVSARTSSFAYRERNADIATIGQELGVATVLEGSVQRAGDQLRVVAQLIRTDTQEHLWSKTFDRSTEDIFVIQDEIAAAVTASLVDSTSTDTPETARTGTDVYDLYMEGRQLWQERDQESVDRAVELLGRAVAMDPDYAPASSELATALLFQVIYGEAELENNRSLIERHVRNALAIDPDNAQAWATRGLLLEQLDLKAEAVAALHKAESLSPNDANIQVWLGNRYLDAGRFNEAAKHFEHALELDPLNTFVRARYTNSLSNIDSNHPAIERVARDTVRLFPDNEGSWQSLVNVLRNKGETADMILTAFDAARHHPDTSGWPMQVAGGFATLGDQETADLWVARALQIDHETLVWPGIYLERDVDRFLELALEQFEAHGNANMSQLVTAYRLAGRIDDAWDLVQTQIERVRSARRSGQPASIDDFDGLLTGVWLARQRGEEEDARILGELVDEKLEEIRETGVLDNNVAPDLAVAAVHGEMDRVLELLPEVLPAHRGYLGTIIPIDPIYQPIVEEPQVQAFIAEVHNRREQQLQSLRQSGPPALFDPEQGNR